MHPIWEHPNRLKKKKKKPKTKKPKNSETAYFGAVNFWGPEVPGSSYSSPVPSPYFMDE